MAEAIVTVILEKLATILLEQIEGGVSLVVDVDEEAKKLTSNFQAIRAVIDDAEKRQVKETAVRDWLDKLKDAAYDIEDVLDEWNTAIGQLRLKKATSAFQPMRKVRSLLCSHFLCCKQVVLRNDFALKIKDLNRTLDIIAMEKNGFGFSSMIGTAELERPATTSFIDVSEVFGRDQHKQKIVDLLLKESTCGGPALPVISVVGMGGIGKTTLARLVFNDDEVITHFDKKIWVCVSDPFNEIRVAKAILESLTGVATNFVELETVLQHIRQSVEGKKFLLVLDDVWCDDSKYWEQLKHCLKCGSRGSRILVTTRKENVAIMMETTSMIPLGTLHKTECWSFFSQVALLGRTNEDCEELNEIGKKIVEKCKGLPLAIKTLASLLRFKRKREWQSILDNEIWEIEEVENELFRPLLLSYYDLSPTLRKCFSYCAIFSKDYEIETDKLIKLWMAQGYLREERNKDMESMGEKCFKNLAMRSFFQDFEKHHDGRIIRCKMHDVIHDFAQFLAKDECNTVKVYGLQEFQLEFSYKKARHTSVIFDGEDSFPIPICNEKKMRSLVVQHTGRFLFEVALPNLFDRLTCLRTLELSDSTIHVLPRNIEKLIHLRFLNLRNNLLLKELPGTLCKLFNLQTLNISGCRSIVQLPQGIEKLINLRHLMNYQTSFSYMPKGFERLTCLRTLREFVVSGDGFGSSKVCSTLASFENLNHLGGYLSISGLGNVVDFVEAKKAELKRKKSLSHLELFFNSNKEIEGRTNEDDKFLLEVLQPPSNLEELKIAQYGGKTVSPSWLIPLTKLRRLTLSYCENCEHLPPLGRLSSLEYLSLNNMSSLKRVGDEFLGIESDLASSSSSFIIAFPKLKSLKFESLDEWEEWDTTRREDKDVTLMPCLRSLTINFCIELKVLPDHILQKTTLEELNIHLCSKLKERYEREIGEDWSKISHIPTVNIESTLRRAYDQSQRDSFHSE